MEPLSGVAGEYASCLKERSQIKCVCGFQFNLDSSDDKEKYAFILPCLHSVCFSCVTSNIYKLSIRCPVCDYKCYVGKDIVSVLPKNKEKLPDDLEEFFVKCSSCKSKSEYFCRSCNIDLCSRCKNRHYRNSKKHNIVTSHFGEPNEKACDTHTNNTLKYFCSTCRIAICKICKGSKHPTHKVKELNTENNQNRSRLLKILSDIESLKIQVGNNITKMEIRLNDILEAFRKPKSPRKETKEYDIECLHHSSKIYILRKMLISLNDYKKRLKIGENIALQNLYKEDPIHLAEIARDIIFNLLCLILEAGCHENYEGFQRFRTEYDFACAQPEDVTPGLVKNRKNLKQSASASNLRHRRSLKEHKEEKMLLKSEANKDRQSTAQVEYLATKGIIVHKTVLLKRELFQNVEYLLSEANFSLTHMGPVLKDIDSCICNLLTSYDLGTSDLEEHERLLIIVNEIRSVKFRMTDVRVKLIGDEADTTMFKALTGLEHSEKDGKLHIVDQVKSHSFEMDALYICWQKDHGIKGGYFEPEMLKVLNSLSSYYLQNAIFVTNPDESNKTRMIEHLQTIFPESFSPGSKYPRFSTPDELRNILANALLENVYDLIETLDFTIDKCLEEFGDDGTKIQEYKEEIYRKKLHVLQEAKIDLKSLIQERPSKRSSRRYLQEVPREICTKLHRLKDSGLMGYGMHREDFLAFVDKDVENFDDLQKEVRSIVSSHRCNCKFFLSPKPMFKQFISNGNKIIPGTTESYGTLGVFAKHAETSKLLALTSGHVTQIGHDVFVPGGKKLGMCIEGTRGECMHAADLAVVKIDEKIESECDPVYQRDGKRFSLRRFQGTTRDLAHYQRVFKVGATTGLTRGVIDIGGESVEPAGVFILIRSVYEDQPFSAEGDSGAIVCMKEDGELTDITALTMIFGGKTEFQSAEKTTPETSEKRDYTATFMINDALDKINDELPITFISKD